EQPPGGLPPAPVPGSPPPQGSPRPPPRSRPALGRRTGPATGIPEIQFALDPALLEEMRGRAALYRSADHTVFLNPEHFRYRDSLEKLYEEAGPDADRQALAQQLFDEEYSYQAGSFIVYAWVYKGRTDWTDQEWQEALSMETLTIHLTGPGCLHEAQ